MKKFVALLAMGLFLAVVFVSTGCNGTATTSKPAAAPTTGGTGR